MDIYKARKASRKVKFSRPRVLYRRSSHYSSEDSIEKEEKIV